MSRQGDVIGEVRAFARAELPPGWLDCDGRVLEIAEHQPLFSLLGWRFGGDGWTTFRLPELRRYPAASVQPLPCGIAVNGIYPTRTETMIEADHIGEIRHFAGLHAPPGWLPCDGRELPIEAPYLELYAAIGKTWGGGAETFALPNLWSEPDPGTTTEGEGFSRLSYIVAIGESVADAPHQSTQS
jgi:microcystin-dependent protein